jgi:hypothetical protein
MASVVLLLAALVFDLAGKSYASQAITTIARDGEHLAAARDADLADVLTGVGMVVAVSGGVCSVVAIAKGEAGPHWPMLLAGGMYVILVLVMV